jgi:hypothetical protein
MAVRDSLLTRWLEPVVEALWTLFAIVSVLVGVVWALGIGDATLGRWVQNADLLRALLWLLRYLDLTWIVLAAANVYRGVAASEGLATVRRWAGWTMLAVMGLAWVSVVTGAPLGAIRFGEPLGGKLGPVPLGLPLLWLVIILGAREAVLRCFPRWSHWQVALGTGVLTALTDLLLEPLAAKLRGFWFWRASAPGLPPVFDPPPLHWLEWGVMAGLLAYTFRSRRVVASVQKRPWEPAATLGIFYAIFLVAHLGRWLRG